MGCFSYQEFFSHVYTTGPISQDLAQQENLVISRLISAVKACQSGSVRTQQGRLADLVMVHPAFQTFLKVLANA